MTAYYNERDAFAAAWLRELIKDGLIAPGDVDERDIQQVTADDFRGYTQCHFFAGIGGWSYALRLAGWPDDRAVWTGSCPCQPLSSAGQRKGHADQRHLWPAFHRLIAECRPSVVFGEQVAGKDGQEWLAGIRADLEAGGYAVGAADLPAAGVGAPHIRQRLYWVADAGRGGIQRRGGPSAAHGAPESYHDVGNRGADGDGLADTDGGIAGHGRLQPGGQHGQQPQDGGVGGGLGDTDDTRSQGRLGAVGAERAGERPAGPHGPCGPADFWSRAEWLACSDGKARRVEPGIFPLAHGIPNRVGQVRGAGNAIVPQDAVQFIGAYLEVRAAP